MSRSPRGHRVPQGVYSYHLRKHTLLQIGPPPDGIAPAVVGHRRSVARRMALPRPGYRHLYSDAGAMLSQLLVAADSAGVIGPHLRHLFRIGLVTALVGADGAHDCPSLLSPSTMATPALDPTGRRQ